MRSPYKGIMLLFILVVIAVQSVYATSRDDDCDLIQLASLSEKSRENDPGSSFLSYTDIQIAFRHLSAYCCKSVVLSASFKDAFCKKDKPSSYPQSPFLLDHLLDVGLRKLDAVGIYDQENQLPDKQGQDWRTYLTETTTKSEGVSPQDIQTTYASFWKVVTGDLIDYNPLYSLKQYEIDVSSKANLFVKYMNECAVVFSIYDSLRTKDGPLNQKKYYKKCQELVASRVKKEFVLTRLLLVQNATRQLTNNVQVYTDNFSQNRLMGLADKFAKIMDLLGIVAKQAPLSKKCNE